MRYEAGRKYAELAGRFYGTLHEYEQLKEYFKLINEEWGHWDYTIGDDVHGIPVYLSEEDTVLEFIKLMEQE